MNNSETKVFENHAQDSRIRELDGYSPAIPAKAGTGGAISRSSSSGWRTRHA